MALLQPLSIPLYLSVTQSHIRFLTACSHGGCHTQSPKGLPLCLLTPVTHLFSVAPSPTTSSARVTHTTFLSSPGVHDHTHSHTHTHCHLMPQTAASHPSSRLNIPNLPESHTVPCMLSVPAQASFTVMHTRFQSHTRSADVTHVISQH